MEKTLGQVAYDSKKQRNPLNWSMEEQWLRDQYERMADAVVAAHEARRWRPIKTAPKDGGKTWILGRGKYAHPFDPAFDEVVVVQIYYNRLYRDWFDTEGARFLPTVWTPIPAPPKEGSDVGQV